MGRHSEPVEILLTSQNMERRMVNSYIFLKLIVTITQTVEEFAANFCFIIICYIKYENISL